MPRFAPVFLCIASVLALAACEHAGPLEPELQEATLESIQTSIFNSSCALSNCHQGPSAQMGLDLSEGAARENLVGVASRELPSFLRVDPGNPDDSYLVMKIEGDSRISGQQMPLGRSALSAEQIQLVRDWIEQGTE